MREKKLINLEKAVNKMTGNPATNFKFHDRGILKEGSYADVVIFNPKTIRDCATFEKPIQKAFGIHTVIVNGAIAWVNGEGTGSRTGCLLKNPVCN